MERSTRRAVVPVVALLVGAALLGTAGCSSSSKAKVSSAASSALGAAESLASQGASAANSVASQAASGASALASSANGLSSSAASAQAAASSALAKVSGGLDATADVVLGAVTTASDGHAEAPLTVTNHQSQAEKYTIQVEYKDGTGKLLDTVVVQIPSLAPAQSTKATARSTQPLSGTVTATVANALRY